MTTRLSRLATFLAPALALLMQVTPATAAEAETQPGTARPWYELGMMADPILDQTLLFYLGQSWQNMTDIGECLATAAAVDGTDPYSWSRAWTATATRLQGVAEDCRDRGHQVSAGETWLRAATCYTAALHRYPDPDAPEVRALAASAVACFGEAFARLDLPVEPAVIPYDGTTLPGWFFRAGGGERAPTLIVQQGRDGWSEHCLYIAIAAIKRGYNCLLFEGPGQGKVLRLQGLPFRPDWENVVTPVVDWVVARDDVDPQRVGLVGLSMGGALVPRAAAFEQRLKVCVANPGVVSWRAIIRGFIGRFDPTLADLWRTDPAAFDAAIARISQQVPLVAWGIRDTMWKHGVKTPSAMMAALDAYTNEGLLDKIHCRMLIMDGEADDFSQGEAMFAALDCPRERIVFTAADTGLQHCQVGAAGVSVQRMFDWLDDNLKPVP
jgi:alpha-beta hydrolase superfamily lysophospholipase